MNAMLPNPWQFNSPEFTPLSVDTAAAAGRNAPDSVVAAELISEPARSLEFERHAAPLTPAVTEPPSPVAAAFSDEDCISELVRNATYYTPEYFSDYAHRRSMAIVSPNHGQREPREFEPDFDAMYDYIVPPEPQDYMPLFLRGRQPSAFAPEPTRSIVDSLLKVAGVRA